MAIEIERTQEFMGQEKYLIKLYLQYGSLYKVLKAHPDIEKSTPVSSYHRLIRTWGLVNNNSMKETGPHRTPISLGGAAEVLLTMAKTGGKLQTVYHYIEQRSRVARMRHDFLPSLSSMHRAYRNTLENDAMSEGTLLMVSKKNDPTQIFFGIDSTVTRYDENGSNYHPMTLPATHSFKGDGAYQRVVRVLQQEVLSKLAARNPGIPERLSIDSQFTRSLIVENTSYLCSIRIGHTDVRTYMFTLPEQLTEFTSSYRLENVQFSPLSEIVNNDLLWSPYRPGMVEIARVYQRRLNHIPYNLHQEAQINTRLKELSRKN